MDDKMQYNNEFKVKHNNELFTFDNKGYNSNMLK